MKSKIIKPIQIFILGLLLAACENTQKENTALAASASKEKRNIDSFDLIRQDSLSKIRLIEQRQKKEDAIATAEKDFYKSIQEVDKEYGENNYKRIQTILKTHQKTPYDLYFELTEIYKKSEKEAIQSAISAGMKERKYTNFIGDISAKYIRQFQTKYGIDHRLYICFKNNYCNCLGNNSDKYCSSKHPIFPNGEYWKKY